jgi:hypothetical protein
MTRRFILYIAAFNVMVATAAAPPLAWIVARTSHRALLPFFGLFEVPPLTITYLVDKAIRAYVGPGAWGGDTFLYVVFFVSCAMYYVFLFVVFLPIGRRRGPELPLPVGWRKPWKVFAIVVAVLHVVWVGAGMIFFLSVLS